MGRKPKAYPDTFLGVGANIIEKSVREPRPIRYGAQGQVKVGNGYRWFPKTGKQYGILERGIDYAALLSHISDIIFPTM